MKKIISMLLVVASILLVFTACGAEEKKPKLSELSDEDMMAYLKENGIKSRWDKMIEDGIPTTSVDIYGERLHEFAEELRKEIIFFEDHPEDAYFMTIARGSGVTVGPVNEFDLLEVVNKYYGLNIYGKPLSE